MPIPRLTDVLPPGQYPILNAFGLVGVLLVGAAALLLIFVVVRDGRFPWNNRKDDH